MTIYDVIYFAIVTALFLAYLRVRQVSQERKARNSEPFCNCKKHTISVQFVSTTDSSDTFRHTFKDARRDVLEGYLNDYGRTLLTIEYVSKNQVTAWFTYLEKGNQQ